MSTPHASGVDARRGTDEGSRVLRECPGLRIVGRIHMLERLLPGGVIREVRLRTLSKHADVFALEIHQRIPRLLARRTILERIIMQSRHV